MFPSNLFCVNLSFIFIFHYYFVFHYFYFFFSHFIYFLFSFLSLVSISHSPIIFLFSLPLLHFSTRAKMKLILIKSINIFQKLKSIIIQNLFLNFYQFLSLRNHLLNLSA